jgi:C4-dicarboxylate-specific signal transduction histidine kinase
LGKIAENITTCGDTLYLEEILASEIFISAKITVIEGFSDLLNSQIELSPGFLRLLGRPQNIKVHTLAQFTNFLTEDSKKELINTIQSLLIGEKKLAQSQLTISIQDENTARFKCFLRLQSINTGIIGIECNCINLTNEDHISKNFAGSDQYFAQSDSNPDFDKMKEYEQELKRYTRKLERSNKDLKQFAYVASHDLQEPLRGIRNAIQILEMRLQGKLDEQSKKLMGLTIESADRLKELIRDLLFFSQVESDEKKMTQVDTKDLLGSVLSGLSSTIENGNINIVIDDLPVIYADESQIFQLFQNLIDNALKFSDDSRKNTIEIRSKVINDEYEFSIADRGIGIEEEHYGYIFEIFKRLHSKDEYPGTGIGLSICSKIVDNHGGTIWLESEPGVGTTFFFTIPIKEE